MANARSYANFRKEFLEPKLRKGLAKQYPVSLISFTRASRSDERKQVWFALSPSPNKAYHFMQKAFEKHEAAILKIFEKEVCKLDIATLENPSAFKQAMAKIINLIAMRIRNSAINFAPKSPARVIHPKGPKNKYGPLVKSIYVEPGSRYKSDSGFGAGSLSVVVVSHAVYAEDVEEGGDAHMLQKITLRIKKKRARRRRR